MNRIISIRPKLKKILKVNSDEDFHSFFFQNSLSIYKKNLKNKNEFGSVLALGANRREAEELIKFPFKKIIISNISSPDEKTKEIIRKDKRVSYKKENMEKISFRDNSFDLVFVKEAVHHVPRPVLAFYECLRVSKNSVIFIEPNETALGNLLEKFGLTSKYEKNFEGNLKLRDNYVYRWRKKEIVKILNSYFLESGYKVIFSETWMSNRFNAKFKFLIKIFNFFGWLVSFIPFNRGNYLICFIVPGKDLPK